MTIHTLLAIACATSVAVLAAIAPTAAQAPARESCDRACIARLEAQLAIYRSERARHERGEVSLNLSFEDARLLDEQALAQLPSVEKVVRNSKETWDGISLLLSRRFTIPTTNETAAERQRREEILQRGLSGGPDIAQKVYDAGRSLQAVQARDWDNRTALDNEIATYEQSRKLLKGAFAWDLGGIASTPTKVVDTLIASQQIRALIIRMGMSTSESERLYYREQALTETRKGLNNLVDLGKKTFSKDFVPQLKLLQLDAEIWAPIGYWAAATAIAGRQRATAMALQSDMIAVLSQRMMATQYEIDQAERALRIQQNRAASARTREPGGITMSGIAADALAAKLDITDVGFDAARGRLIFSGRRSEHAIDLTVFTDVLRLAVEEHEPFFSLEPVTPADHDQGAIFLSARIRDTYFAGVDGIPVFIDRLQRGGVPIQLPGGDPARMCYATDIRRFDPALNHQLEEALDVRSKRIYSPEWLANSPVGRILFEADVAIKAVTTGLLAPEGDLSVAAVWDIEDYAPEWLDGTSHDPGRVNFELDQSSVPTDGTMLNLSDVKPKLVMVRRMSGTHIDLPPGESEKRIAQHFDDHWREYVARVPVFQELMTVFRAYVAARYLAQRHPSLVQRVLAMGDPIPGPGRPLYWAGSHSMVSCVQNGQLAPLGSDPRIVYRVMRWPGGGIAFKHAERIGYQPLPAGAMRTRAPLLQRVVDDERLAYTDAGDSAAFVLDLDTLETVPSSTQRVWWAACVGAAVLLLGVMAFARRRHVLPTDIACDHCARVHRLAEALGGLGDALAVGTVAFVVALPFWAATEEAGRRDWRTLLAVAAVVALLTAAGLLFRIWHTIVATMLGWSGAWAGPLRHVGAGARWLGVAFALLLAADGLSDRAVGARLAGLGGGLGERLLAMLESADVIRAAVLMLLAAAALALFARWLLPFALGSRPLPLGFPAHAQTDH